MAGAHKAQSSDRFQTIVALLIAVVSVVSTGVIWRASLAGSGASTADRQGLVTTVKYEAAYAETVLTLYEEAHYAAQFDRYRARVETLQAQRDPAAQSEAGWVGQIVSGLAGFTPLTTDPAYRAADADLRDLDPQQYFTAADWLYFESEAPISAVVVLAVALFFLTLAEITHYKVRIGLAVVGTLVFLLGLANIVAVEVYLVFSRMLL